MFANKKFLLLGLAVLIIISAVFFVMRNNLRQKGQELVNQQQNAETEKKESESIFSEEEATDLSRRFEKEFDTAFNMARGWQADSVMAAELIQYKGLASATNGKDTFVFYSPSSPQYYWTISFEPKADSPSERFYSRAIYYKDDYILPSGSIPVVIKYLVKDYATALLTADGLGGKNIRAKNGNYDINILLSSEKDQYLLWKVEYLVGGKTVFSTMIDAYTGKELTDPKLPKN